MELSKIKKAYFIGIKGSGMAAVAEIFTHRGIEVTGSDTKEKFFTDEILKRNNIKFYESFSASHIPDDVDLIVYSTAYSENANEELKAAKESGVALKSYPEILGMLFNDKLGIAVCGTHGKTTTTALLAQALQVAGADPSVIVGSQVIQWQGSSLSGQGQYFVAEADEYQNKFQHYNPWGVVLTSIDWDHPDFFPDFEKYKEAFREFIKKIPRHGFLVVWGDSASTNEIAKEAKCDVIRYGALEGNDIRVSDIRYQVSSEGASMQGFTAFQAGKRMGDFEIQLAGTHNVLNAAAVLAVCKKLKLDIEKVKEALHGFQGTTRRFEYKGKYNGAILIDDYAHHPEEIKVTLKAARDLYPHKNIWAVFHPHTFTRTKALLPEFSQSFDDADNVIVIDIYGSARETQGGVSSKDLVDLINKYQPEKAEYIPAIPEAVKYLRKKIANNDLVIAMGAGDVWKILEKLKNLK